MSYSSISSFLSDRSFLCRQDQIIGTLYLKLLAYSLLKCVCYVNYAAHVAEEQRPKSCLGVRSMAAPVLRRRTAVRGGVTSYSGTAIFQP